MVVTNSDRPPASILPKNIKKLKFLGKEEGGDNIAVNIKAMIVNSNQVN